MEFLSTFVILSLIAAYVYSAYIGKKDRDARHSKKAASIKEIYNPNGKYSEYYLSSDFTFIGIDHIEQKVLLGKNFEAKIYSYSDLVKAELIRDGASISSVNRGSQMGNALLGGLIFGGAGAVVGAMGSSQTTHSLVKNLSLRIVVDDVQTPFWDVTFFNSYVGINADFDEVKLAKHQSDRFAILLNNILIGKGAIEQKPTN